MGNVWAKIVSTLTGQTVGEILDYKIAKKRLVHERELEKLKGKIEYEKAKSERAARSEGFDHEWETMQIQNSGWKDEFVLIVLSIPMFFVFFPGTEVYVAQGFAALETTPEWYRWLVMTIYGATFGIRLWRRRAL